MMNFHNAFNDSQSQPMSLGLGSQCAVKAIKNALTFFRSNPGTIVTYFNDGVVLFALNREPDTSIGLRIANRIISKVGNLKLERIFHAGYDNHFGSGFKRDIFLLSQHREFVGNSTDHFVKFD